MTCPVCELRIWHTGDACICVEQLRQPPLMLGDGWDMRCYLAMPGVVVTASRAVEGGKGRVVVAASSTAPWSPRRRSWPTDSWEQACSEAAAVVHDMCEARDRGESAAGFFVRWEPGRRAA